MTADLLPQVFTALALGLLGGGHCIGMCGGLMGALTLAIPAEQRKGWPLWRILLSYNLGRISSYTLAGALLGSFGWALQGMGLGVVLRTIAGLLMICMGLYLANWWSGLTRIESLGRGLWRHIEPRARRLLPVQRPGQALLLGMLWGWLPCGLVYSSLVWASSHGSSGTSALLMLAFGLGTLPTLLATGAAADKLTALLRKRSLRIGAASLIIAFGLWTLPGPHQQWIISTFSPPGSQHSGGHHDHAQP
ncbi:sulfite exporter TauE/SafE family protein [Halopseudomonas sp.]|uniref:sulfite exporter TauE/SafE family protein n=1 Tax=Halopseudomonas sp. TaxID=2901191 RepID=UPI0030027AB2